MTLSAANEASAEADAFASDPAVYKTLLESTLAIPWRIDWATMTFAYIGPQIEPLLGWQRDSWKTIDDWVARMHPEDRETVVGSQTRVKVVKNKVAAPFREAELFAASEAALRRGGTPARPPGARPNAASSSPVRSSSINLSIVRSPSKASFP